jgi:hypothetical protein
MSPFEEQKEATGLIHNNQIVIVTGERVLEVFGMCTSCIKFSYEKRM